MTEKAEVPFLGTLITSLLYPLLIYIAFNAYKLHSIIFGKQEERDDIQKELTEDIEKEISEKTQTQKKPEPKKLYINHNTKKEQPIYLTYLIITQNCVNTISQFLLDLLSYFNSLNEQNPDFTFEIFVIDNFSSDHTPQLASDIAYQHSEIRFFRLKEKCTQTRIVLKAFRISHGRVFYFSDISDSFSFSQYLLFDQKYKQFSSTNQKLMIIGVYPKKQHNISNLQLFLSTLNHYFWNYFGLEKEAQNHCHSFLISNEAFLTILPLISIDTDSITDQFLTIAINSQNSISIHSVKLQDESLNSKITSPEMLEILIIHFYFYVKSFLSKLNKLILHPSSYEKLQSLKINTSNILENFTQSSKNGKVE